MWYLNLIYQGKEETVFNVYTEDLKNKFLKSQDKLLKIGLGCVMSTNFAKEQVIPDDLYNKAIKIIYGVDK